MEYSKKQIVEAISYWQKKLIEESMPWKDYLHPSDKDILQHFYRYKDHYKEGEWTPVNVDIRDQHNQIIMPFIMWRNGHGQKITSDAIWNKSTLNWESLVKLMSHNGLTLQHWNKLHNDFQCIFDANPYACEIINDPQEDDLRVYRVFLKHWLGDDNYPAYSPKWVKNHLYNGIYIFSKVVQKDYIEDEQNFNNEKSQLAGLFRKNKITPIKDDQGNLKDINDVEILKIPVKRYRSPREPNSDYSYYLADTVKLIAYGRVDSSIDDDRNSRFRKNEYLSEGKLKYTKKQVFEALSYWQKQLKKNLNESIEDKTITIKEMLDQISKYPIGNYVQIELPNHKKVAAAGLWNIDSLDTTVKRGFLLTSHFSNAFEPKSGQSLNNRELINRCKHMVDNNFGDRNIYVQNNPNNYRDLCGISNITCDRNMITIHCIES